MCASSRSDIKEAIKRTDAANGHLSRERAPFPCECEAYEGEKSASICLREIFQKTLAAPVTRSPASRRASRKPSGVEVVGTAGGSTVSGGPAATRTGKDKSRWPVLATAAPNGQRAKERERPQSTCSSALTGRTRPHLAGCPTRQCRKDHPARRRRFPVPPLRAMLHRSMRTRSVCTPPGRSRPEQRQQRRAGMGWDRRWLSAD
jgi:hypothetical protein